MAKRRLIKSNWAYVPVLLLVILFVSEITWYTPYLQPKASSLEIFTVLPEADSLSVSFELKAGFYTDATVVAIPVESVPTDLPVYLFFDSHYISVGTDWVMVSRLWEHLEIELRLRGYTGAVNVVNAEGLEDVFLSKESAVVALAYGAFPSNIFSWKTNLVSPWLEAGGTLVWLGWEVGFYSVDQNQNTFRFGLSNQLHREGIKRLGMDPYIRLTGNSDPSGRGTDETALSKALDIRYEYIRCGLLYAKVVSSGGLVLGKIGEVDGTVDLASKASVAAVQVGKGTVLTFGFFVGSEDQAGDRNEPASFYSIARDIAQILCSGILHMSADQQAWYQRYQLASGQTSQDSFTLPISSETQGVVVYGYNSVDSTGLLYFRKYLSLPTER
jgi:hypothetical protein